MNFKDYYPLPYKLFAGHKAMTNDHNMVFDFIPAMVMRDSFQISPEERLEIINFLNGEVDNLDLQYDCTYKDGTIYVGEQQFIWIRGWGHLTGTGGGLGLSSEEATKIQDGLGNYLVEKLKRN
jgi:hypothetical protein